jgi:hypothetical protein
MGTLTPGASYIYEHIDGVTYAREFGADPNTRQVIGYNGDLDILGKNKESTVLGMPMSQVAEYIEIVSVSKFNPSLQEALDRVKVLYYLIKEDGDKKT